MKKSVLVVAQPARGAEHAPLGLCAAAAGTGARSRQQPAPQRHEGARGGRSAAAPAGGRAHQQPPPPTAPTGAPRAGRARTQIAFWHSMGGDIGGKAIPQLATDFNAVAGQVLRRAHLPGQLRRLAEQAQGRPAVQGHARPWSSSSTSAPA